MKVPAPLPLAFGNEFENWIAQFAYEQKLLPSPDDIRSRRYLARSIVPHIKKLSSLFNRQEGTQDDSLSPYWKKSSHPENLRLAYFLYFMPSNLYRMASIWTELGRLGYRWNHSNLKVLEFGAGSAAGSAGIAAGEKIFPLGLPKTGDWALIEQDRASLDLGNRWLETYFHHLAHSGWNVRPFHRTLSPEKGFLPPSAPQFNLWLMSFFLNELSCDVSDLARHLLRDWKKHLADEGIVILVEPALKLQSRRLLELRKELLKQNQNKMPLQILLPCLGHQTCGALENPEDWCHEDVSWWRPPYFRILDQLAGLDRKSLPFSYLVLIKSNRAREEILPELAPFSENERQRLVSPAHSEGKELEFFICGQTGKKRASYRPKPEEMLERGDILMGAQLRGDKNSTRISGIKKKP